jgi:hypothetical protein
VRPAGSIPFADEFRSIRQILLFDDAFKRDSLHAAGGEYRQPLFGQVEGFQVGDMRYARPWW